MSLECCVECSFKINMVLAEMCVIPPFYSLKSTFLKVVLLFSLTICCISGLILYPIHGKCQTRHRDKGVYSGHTLNI